LAAIAALSVLRGWVLSIIWGWFLVPLGLPAIGIAQAIAISLIASFLTHQAGDKKREGKEIAELWAGLLLNPLLALGMAWIVKQFL
jgi:hypothetical protein